MLLQEERVVLHIPAKIVTEPIIYRLVKDFDVAVNVLKVEVVENDEGLMVLGIQGTSSALTAAKKYLTERGVRLEALKRDVHLREDRCTHCGACIGQCPSGALTMTAEYEVKLDPKKCIACGHCAIACTYDAVDVKFGG